MFELYHKAFFTKKWKKIGSYTTFQEAYSTLNAVMSGFPCTTRQTFRITGAYQ